MPWGRPAYQTEDQPPNTLIIKPAAQAEPITPATLGPIACMSRKFVGFSFWPTTWETRAAIGTADTPAEPIKGLTLPPVRTYIKSPSNRPPAVDSRKAVKPRATIPRVWGVRN